MAEEDLENIKKNRREGRNMPISFLFRKTDCGYIYLFLSCHCRQYACVWVTGVAQNRIWEEEGPGTRLWKQAERELCKPGWVWDFPFDDGEPGCSLIWISTPPVHSWLNAVWLLAGNEPLWACFHTCNEVAEWCARTFPASVFRLCLSLVCIFKWGWSLVYFAPSQTALSSSVLTNVPSWAPVSAPALTETFSPHRELCWSEEETEVRNQGACTFRRCLTGFQLLTCNASQLFGSHTSHLDQTRPQKWSKQRCFFFFSRNPHPAGSLLGWVCSSCLKVVIVPTPFA